MTYNMKRHDYYTLDKDQAANLRSMLLILLANQVSTEKDRNWIKS